MVAAVDLDAMRDPAERARVGDRRHRADLHAIVPFAQPMKFLDVAMADPTNLGVLDELRIAHEAQHPPCLAGPKMIERAIGKYYGRGFSRFYGDIPLALDERRPGARASRRATTSPCSTICSSTTIRCQAPRAAAAAIAGSPPSPKPPPHIVAKSGASAEIRRARAPDHRARDARREARRAHREAGDDRRSRHRLAQRLLNLGSAGSVGATLTPWLRLAPSSLRRPTSSRMVAPR